MSNPVSLLIVISATLALTVTTPAAGNTEKAEGKVGVAVADAAAGEKLYRKSCRACHGPTGKGLSSYPKLLGQSVEYLVDRLERYRKGEKFGPNTPLMAPNAKKLSDEDIVNLSAFIASFE